MSETTISGTLDISGTTSGSLTTGSSIDLTGTTGSTISVTGSIATDTTIVIDAVGSISLPETTIVTETTLTPETTLAPSAVTLVPSAPVTPPTPPAATKISGETTPVKPPMTVQEVNDSRQVSIIEELLANYKKILSARVINLSGFQSAAVDLSSVMIRILNNPTQASLDVVWNFFVENAAGVLQEQIALSGMETLSLPVRQRTELAYTIFRKATKGIDVADTKIVNETTLKTLLKSPKVVAYLSAKTKAL